MLVSIEPTDATPEWNLEAYAEHVADVVQTEGFVRAQRFRHVPWTDPAPWGPATAERQADAWTRHGSGVSRFDDEEGADAP